MYIIYIYPQKTSSITSCNDQSTMVCRIAHIYSHPKVIKGGTAPYLIQGGSNKWTLGGFKPSIAVSRLR